MTKPTDTNDVEKIHRKVELLLGQKISDDQIINLLTKEGFQPYYIETVIENVRNDIANKASFKNSMIMGAIYILAGLMINYLSYTAAANANSLFFYLFVGIILLGVTTIARGFILYKK